MKKQAHIQATIKAYQLANEAAAYHTAEGLRSLAMSGLVSLAIDPQAKETTRLQALKAIGQISEVSLFTHRTESKVIHSSDDARARLLAEIKSMMNATAEDAQLVERDALSLLDELSAGENSASADPTAPAPPQNAESDPMAALHTIPSKQSQNPGVIDPPPSITEQAPL